MTLLLSKKKLHIPVILILRVQSDSLLHVLKILSLNFENIKLHV